jgi:hypothetical protein
MTLHYRSDKGSKEATRARRRIAKAARKEARAAENRHLEHVVEVDPTEGVEPIDVAKVPDDLRGIAKTLNYGGPLP